MRFRTWLENYSVLNLIEGDDNIDTIGYHVSNAVFDQFDDSRLGSNTYQGPNQRTFSVDSFFGHQFYEDPNFLFRYGNREELLGRYMYKANLRIGRAAIINIRKLKPECPDPQTAFSFKQQLQRAGYNGIRFVGGGEGRLANNTVVAFSSNSVRIRSVKNLKTGTEIQAKNGPFSQQIKDLRSNPQHYEKAKAAHDHPTSSMSQLKLNPV